MEQLYNVAIYSGQPLYMSSYTTLPLTLDTTRPEHNYPLKCWHHHSTAKFDLNKISRVSIKGLKERKVNIPLTVNPFPGGARQERHNAADVRWDTAAFERAAVGEGLLNLLKR